MNAKVARERRTDRRWPVQISVFLYRGGQPVATGETRDVGRGGMLVVPQPALPGLPRRWSLEIGMSHEQNGVARRFRVPARVAHFGDRGLGLAFASGEVAVQNAIDQVLADALGAGDATG